jgi:hypothetical protein
MANDSPFHHLYNNARWRKASRDFRSQQENVFCHRCQENGKLDTSKNLGETGVI